VIKLKDGEIAVRIVGKTNVVLTVEFHASSAQINMRKIKNNWYATYKKDTIEWGLMFVKNEPHADNVFWMPSDDWTQEMFLKLHIIPALEQYLYEKEVEKILLH
jgi:hypothetical protein